MDYRINRGISNSENQIKYIYREDKTANVLKNKRRQEFKLYLRGIG